MAGLLGRDAELITAATWLHDIGYSPAIAAAGFHPLDGARHLRDRHHAGQLLCRLVAHHSCAAVEVAGRGLADELTAEFPPPPARLADALAYCDMTTGPDGQRTPVAQRLAEIRARYGPDHLVSRAIAQSAPHLAASTARIACQLAR